MKQTAQNHMALFGLCLGIFFGATVLFGCAGAKENQKEKSTALPQVYSASLAQADVYIPVPLLRQYGTYTCGATCVQMLMNRLAPYQADLNLAQYEALLGTTEETGTSPRAILRYFEENGVEYTAQEHLSLAALRKKLDAGHPVLLPLQAWSDAENGSYNTTDPTDTETYLTQGHWVICVGYADSVEKPYFIFNDPACVGNTMLYEGDFDSRWIDMDGAGTIYDHFGIELCGQTEYQPHGVFYMD